MNKPIYSCIFIKKSQIEFEIIVVDDLNLVGTYEEFIGTTKFLKRKFEIKVFGTKFLS